MSNIRTQIRTLGHFVPPLRVVNKDLESLMETSDEWIQQRSGIKERRWVEPGESVSGMAHKASDEALKRAGLKADDVDAIIFATLISDYVFPEPALCFKNLWALRKWSPHWTFETNARASFMLLASLTLGFALECINES